MKCLMAFGVLFRLGHGKVCPAFLCRNVLSAINFSEQIKYESEEK